MNHFPRPVVLFAALALTACGGGGGGGGGGGDTIRPTVSLSGPARVTAADSVTYTATASDASGIASVKFSRGATVLGTDATAPYEQSVTFNASDNGRQTITATATDTAGNSATASQSVTVNIGTGSGLITRLSSCTPVNTSSDPAASTCLAGVYSGKTIDTKDCALTVQADGGYDYASPAMTFTYAPDSKTIRVFDYQTLSGFNQIGWIIGDGVKDPAYELDFTARWGTGVGAPSIEIKPSKTGTAGNQASTCIVPLS